MTTRVIPMPPRPDAVRWSTFACAIGILACTPGEDRYVASAGDLSLMADMPSSSFQELRRGTGRPVAPGDRVTIRVTGHYGDESERFADGQFTFISAGHPAGNLLGPAAYGARVGARRRFTHFIAADSTTGARIATYSGMLPEQEFFRYRNDRGELVFDSEVLTACRPRHVSFMEGNKFAMRFSLGCN